MTSCQSQKMLINSTAITFLLMACCCEASSQNLVINPGAELSPAGIGWTIVSAGANSCALGTPAATYSNWTMTPDQSIRYPAAHGGTKTFFAGCNNTAPAGPFELYQDIDVSDDAAQIDAGFIAYFFTGYIQTPFAPQADAGRFIVDYFSATGTILGSSYNSGYQSYAAGSGPDWHKYADLRKATPGTRKIRIRMQATVATSPAVNAYFDDISLTKTILPVALVSFSGIDNIDYINLRWSISREQDFSRFEIEKSNDAANFVPTGNVDFVKSQTDYHFSDKYEAGQPQIFYRIKVFDVHNQYVYSPIIAFDSSPSQPFSVSPNPATKEIVVSGLHNTGIVFILNMAGNTVLQSSVNSNTLMMNVSQLPKGNYFVYYSDGIALVSKKLLVE